MRTKQYTRYLAILVNTSLFVSLLSSINTGVASHIRFLFGDMALIGFAVATISTLLVIFITERKYIRALLLSLPMMIYACVSIHWSLTVLEQTPNQSIIFMYFCVAILIAVTKITQDIRVLRYLGVVVLIGFALTYGLQVTASVLYIETLFSFLDVDGIRWLSMIGALLLILNVHNEPMITVYAMLPVWAYYILNLSSWIAQGTTTIPIIVYASGVLFVIFYIVLSFSESEGVS